MPRVRPAIEAGFMDSAEAANAHMRQLLISGSPIDSIVQRARGSACIHGSRGHLCETLQEISRHGIIRPCSATSYLRADFSRAR